MEFIRNYKAQADLVKIEMIKKEAENEREKEPDLKRAPKFLKKMIC